MFEIKLPFIDYPNICLNRSSKIYMISNVRKPFLCSGPTRIPPPSTSLTIKFNNKSTNMLIQPSLCYSYDSGIFLPVSHLTFHEKPICIQSSFIRFLYYSMLVVFHFTSSFIFQ